MQKTPCIVLDLVCLFPWNICSTEKEIQELDPQGIRGIGRACAFPNLHNERGALVRKDLLGAPLLEQTGASCHGPDAALH